MASVINDPLATGVMWRMARAAESQAMLREPAF
jgi:hypothetical protein